MSKEKEIRKSTENDIPTAAGKAFSAARKAARRAGHVVLVIENGKLIKITPASEEELRSISRVDPRKIRFRKGVKTAIKWADNQG